MGKAANTSTRTQAGAPNSPGSHCIFTTIRSSSTAEQTLPASPNNVFDKKPVPSSQPACPCSAHPLLTSPELPHTSPPVLGPGRLVCMEHNNRAAKGGPREDIRRAEDRICSLDPLPGPPMSCYISSCRWFICPAAHILPPIIQSQVTTSGRNRRSC